MTEKQYFKREYGETYYIFDSEITSEAKIDAKIEYCGYQGFEDSMQGDEIVNRLNEQNETITMFQKRNKFLEMKINRERTVHTKQDEKWQTEAEEKIKQLTEENKQLRHIIRSMKRK